MIEMQTLGSDELEVIDTAIMDPLLDPAMNLPSMSFRVSNAMNEDELIEVLSSALQAVLFEANSRYRKCV